MNLTTEAIISPGGCAISTRSNLENPQYSLTDPRTYSLLSEGGGSSDTGLSVNEHKYLSVAAVWQCVNLISGDLAKLPLDLYRINEAGDREKLRKHPAHRLVRRRPNEEQNAFFFWRTAFVHKLIWGNAYIYISRDLRGNAQELLLLLPDRTSPKRTGGVLKYITYVDKQFVPVDASNIIHLRGISLDGVEACAPLRYAREVAAMALAARKFGARFFKQGARAGGLLELPAGMKKEAKDKVEEGFRKSYEGDDNWFKTVVLREGAKFHQLTIAPNEGQFNETRENEVREVARFYNLSPSRLGLSDSVSYNSKSEDNQSYLDSTLSPHMEDQAQEVAFKVLTPQEQEDEYYYEHNTKKLLQMNYLQRHQGYALGIRCGIYSPDECRAAENMPKRPDGLGGLYVLQTNLSISGSTGSADNKGIGLDDDLNADKNDKVRSDDRLDIAIDNVSFYPVQPSTWSIDERRIVWALARQARDKASRATAWDQWIRGNWKSYRDELTALGAENLTNQVIDYLLRELTTAVRSAGPEKLVSTVDAVVRRWEIAAASPITTSKKKGSAMSTVTKQPAAGELRQRHTRGHIPQLVTREDGKSPMIVGYAAVFYREGQPGTEYELWEGYVERIMPGAFDRALSEKHDARGTFNHDRNLVLGRTKSGTARLSIDDIGLRYEIDSNPKDPDHVGVMEKLNRRDVDGSSFGFIERAKLYREVDGVLYVEITDLDLFDFGPVTFPAYEGASSGLRCCSPEQAENAKQAAAEWRASRAQMDPKIRLRMLQLDADHAANDAV